MKSRLSATGLGEGTEKLAKTRTKSRMAPVKRILFLSSGRRIALARASIIFTGGYAPRPCGQAPTNPDPQDRDSPGQRGGTPWPGCPPATGANRTAHRPANL